MANVPQQNIQFVPIQNQQVVGKKGPLAAKIIMDFTSQSDYDLDMQHVQSTNQFDLCQSMFIDNADGGAAVTVTIGTSGQRIVAKAGSQGWYNVMVPNPIKLHFSSAGGPVVTVFLVDVAIPGSVWSAV
jgi:hypothetical protein